MEVDLRQLTPLHEHADVRVYRWRDGFIKAHPRVEREEHVLRAPMPGVARPEVLGSGAGWLGLSNARRDPRADRIEDIAGAARVLAAVHDSVVRDVPDAVDWERELQRRAAAAPAELRRHLEEVVSIGDAFCHRDLHPSNWITDGGRVVGLLDWASCGYADPEVDLADLAVASRDASHVEAICDSWEAASGRRADSKRVWLYAWLQCHEEGRPVAPWREGFAAAAPLHGTVVRERSLPKPSGRGWVRCEAPAWLEDSEVEGWAGHACNDVLRVPERGRVVKVFNKPVAPWLFALERELATQLVGNVLAPLRVFRVEGRPAAEYLDAGTGRIGKGRRAVTQLAAALAALHRVKLDTPIPEDEQRISWALIERDVTAPHRERVRELWDDAYEHIANALPRTLVHGGLHRDHIAVEGDRMVLLDFEKAHLGARLVDVVGSALHIAYRGNDEAFDPDLLLRFFRVYHRANPLTTTERDVLFAATMRGLFVELRAIAQDGGDVAAHVAVMQEVADNRANLVRALAGLERTSR